MKNIYIFSTILLFSVLAKAQNVGIGESSPLYKLDVNGDLRVQGNVVRGGASGSMNIISNGGFRIDLDDDGGGSESFRIANGSNSIVFEVTEGGNLDASGNGVFNGNLTLSGNSRLISSGDALNISSNSGLDIIIDGDNSATGSEFYIKRDGVGGTNLFRVDEQGDATVYNKLKITPLATAPTGTKGDMYFDNVTNKLYYHDGTAWREVVNTNNIAASIATLSEASGGGLNTFSYNGGSAVQIGIANAGIDNGKIANDAVTSSKIENGTITADDLGTNSVDLASGDVTGVNPVSKGGTGVNTVTGILQGNGTSAFTGLTATAGYHYLRRNSGNTAFEFGQIDYSHLSGTPNVENPLTFSPPLSRSINTISIPQANTSTNGFLSSTDWNTFNGKLGTALAGGSVFVGNSSNIATAVAISLNAAGGTFGLSNTGVLTFPNANTSTRGLLTSTDWNTFNGKENALTFNSPLSRSGNTVSITEADPTWASGGNQNNNISRTGNVSTTGAVTANADFFGRLNVADTRSTNAAPTTYDNELAIEFKDRATVGAPGDGTFSSLLTIAQWGDNSGDKHHQLNFNNGGIYYRRGNPDNATWESWETVLSPIGSITAYAGSSAPSGWLLCDGAAVSRTTYSALFAIIGTTYGAGNGSTTFNVPNLQNRNIVGRGSGTFASLNGIGGAETHTLTTAQIPAHSHSYTDLYPRDEGGGRFNSDPYGSAPSTSDNDIRVENGDGHGQYLRSWNTGNTGSGNSFNILDPYLVLNYIIKW